MSGSGGFGEGDEGLFPPESGASDVGFPVHVISVRKVAYDDPAESFGIEPTELDYVIDHGACELRGEECIVEHTVAEMGLHAALFGVWDKGEDGRRIRVADYRLRGWVSHSPATPNGPEEWDAGIEEVGEDEQA